MRGVMRGWGLVGLSLAGSTAACGGETAPAPAPVILVEEEPEPEPEVAPLTPLVGVNELVDINPDPSVVEVDLFAHYAGKTLVDGAEVSVMAYNDSWPGPALHARVGDRVIVHFHNQIEEPTTVHWHGLRIPDTMDGNPRIQAPVQPGESFDYEFVVPEAGTFWYHPHANTIEQVEKGLYGPIVIEEAEPPAFTRERVFTLDDIRLTSTGAIAPFLKTGMDLMHGRFGDRLLTNGSTEPMSGTVERGAIERWRLINTANARLMKMSIEGAAFRVVGTDGGLLPQPYETDFLSMTVGQRYDVEVRVDGSSDEVRLVSHVLANVDGQAQEIPIVVASYAVEGETETVEPVYPLVELPPIPDNAIDQPIVLGAVNVGGVVKFTINGASGPDIPDFEFVQGTPVKLVVTNEIGPYHPFHLHGQFFQVLTRDGQPAFEPGLKDSVHVEGLETVEVVTTFDNPGAWMVHCHIGSHAESGMMAHMVVSPAE